MGAGRRRPLGEVKVAAANHAATTVDNLEAIVGDLRSTELTNAPIPTFDGTWEVAISDPEQKVRDAWLVVDWGAEQ